MKIVKLVRVGKNSLTCYIPRAYWEAIGVTLGDYLLVVYGDDSLKITKIDVSAAEAAARKKH